MNQVWANGFADGEPYEHPDRAGEGAGESAHADTLGWSVLQVGPPPPLFPCAEVSKIGRIL